jgi:UDP-2-acetamido-3-amino-2,3-dideoxy-glucuronate N-acetyltransferase
MSGTSAPQIHPSAIVDPGAQVGAGSRIWHFVHVSSGARIGADCSLGQASMSVARRSSATA